MWFYAKGNEQIGPVPREEIEELIEGGIIKPTTLVWRKGMVGWKQAGQTEFASQFPSPPPMPSQRYDVSQDGYHMGAVVPYETFQDLTPLTQWLKALLIFGMVLTAVMLWLQFAEYQEPPQMPAQGSSVAKTEPDNPFETTDPVQNLISATQAPLGILGGVLFFVWVYRANKNIRALGAQNLKFTPGWCVGWFFIPFANFWMPYRAVREISKASMNPHCWQSEEVEPFVNYWWVLAIGSFVLTYAAVLLAFGPDSDPVKAKLFLMFASFMSIVQSGCTIVMVTRILRAQTNSRSSEQYADKDIA